jgi:hypothetical protein
VAVVFARMHDLLFGDATAGGMGGSEAGASWNKKQQRCVVVCLVVE